MTCRIKRPSIDGLGIGDGRETVALTSQTFCKRHLSTDSAEFCISNPMILWTNRPTSSRRAEDENANIFGQRRSSDYLICRNGWTPPCTYRDIINFSFSLATPNIFSPEKFFCSRKCGKKLNNRPTNSRSIRERKREQKLNKFIHIIFLRSSNILNVHMLGSTSLVFFRQSDFIF